MANTGDKWRRRRTGSAVDPPGRMTKGQELALFIFFMIVLVALVIYGMRA